ncbi:hypothetical protein KC952_00905 [Candidatus Saccharibacteria bacterium]|nr:hypothetical protein [Candidatus Saccharibacteria bacterium]
MNIDKKSGHSSTEIDKAVQGLEKANRFDRITMALGGTAIGAALMEHLSTQGFEASIDPVNAGILLGGVFLATLGPLLGINAQKRYARTRLGGNKLLSGQAEARLRVEASGPLGAIRGSQQHPPQAE